MNAIQTSVGELSSKSVCELSLKPVSLSCLGELSCFHPFSHIPFLSTYTAAPSIMYYVQFHCQCKNKSKIVEMVKG